MTAAHHRRRIHPMATVTVRTPNVPLLVAAMGEAATKAIPQATAKALTETAFEGMRAAKSELANSLTLRNRFSLAGIQVNKADAEASAFGITAAEVGIEERRSYLVDHVLGKRRKPAQSPFKAIPNEDFIRRSKSGKVPGRQRPKAMLDRVGETTKGRRDRYILVYEPDGESLFRYVKGQPEPQLVYFFRKSVHIRKGTFDMVGAVQKRAQAVYDRHFVKALDRAMKRIRANA